MWNWSKSQGSIVYTFPRIKSFKIKNYQKMRAEQLSDAFRLMAASQTHFHDMAAAGNYFFILFYVVSTFV